jgi:hypothetical protein
VKQKEALVSGASWSLIDTARRRRCEVPHRLLPSCAYGMSAIEALHTFKLLLVCTSSLLLMEILLTQSFSLLLI